MFDLFLTGYIFRLGGIEANGPASYIWTHYHQQGFAFYKFGLVTIVVLACEGYSIKNIRISRIIITVGCLVYLLVVFWEVFLIITQGNGLKL